MSLYIRLWPISEIEAEEFVRARAPLRALAAIDNRLVWLGNIYPRSAGRDVFWRVPVWVRRLRLWRLGL